MKHTETLTRYTANFVDELARSGITDVVISPGSRSTPLALIFTEHPSIKEWVIIDERSAAFFALGIARETKRAVALVCTSGTAAANYFPAVVEAYYSRVPLVVITADRPHELRDVGAPQAINQTNLYGDYAKWYHEMAIPEATPEMLQYARNKAARATFLAMEENQGPVHINMPFREPLIPDLTLENVWEPVGTSFAENSRPPFTGKKRLTNEQLTQFVERLKKGKRGVIVCGPQYDNDFPEAVEKLAKQWQLPILADPLSQVRVGKHDKENVIEGYDAFLRDKNIRKWLKPEFIIRFGAMPVSKPYLFYVQENKETFHVVIENEAGYREPVGQGTEFVYADATELCKDLSVHTKSLDVDENWLHTWQEMNEITKKHLSDGEEAAITEGEAIRALVEATPEDSYIFAANSMPIRDVDTFLMTTNKNIKVFANRGANGIDGLISSGAGVATSGKRVTIVAGDLSFYHDMNGLLAAKQHQLNMTILLINNNGGGIFSLLPQAKVGKHFEPLFGTPLNLDYTHAVFMYGGKYAEAKTEQQLKDLLAVSFVSEGLHVVEVKTNRTENAAWHREKWDVIINEILEKWS